MQYGSLAGVGTPVSRLIMGADNQETPEAARIFDDYRAAGGNAFDTAWVYSQGRCQQTLGQWVRDRGVRDEVVIIDKVGHTPWDTPELITQHLHECLDRLGLDRIDLLLLHRDNPEIDVGEYIDLLDGFRGQGLIDAYGASNWTTARFDDANTWAAAHGRPPFTALSNNVSLARMLNVPWPGCHTMGDAERAWAAERGATVVPWSSQGRGFFTAAAAPDKRDNAELAACWYSEDNFERKARAAKLAADRGVEEINVALAWVLAQPFPTFPLIGPRTSDELRSSLRALDVALSPEEAAWLDLRT